MTELERVTQRLKLATIGGSNYFRGMRIVCLDGHPIACFESDEDQAIFVKAKLEILKKERIKELEKEREELKARVNEIDMTFSLWSAGLSGK